MSEGRGAPRLVVVGAGVTGLCAAWALSRERPDASLALVEARPRAGGNVATERHDGFVIDAGPDSFLRTKPDAVTLCRELGLESELVTVAERGVYVASRGRLVPLPGGMTLGVPTRFGPLFTTPLFGWRGKLRAALEPFVPRRRAAETADDDESIAAFVERRLGREVVKNLAAPLLGGIYAGDIERLSLRSTFPQLAELEAKHGSLVRGAFAVESERGAGGAARGFGRWLLRGDVQVPSPFYSLRGGMGTLVEALERALPAGTAKKGSAVTAIERRLDGARYDVRLADGSVLGADALLLAVPAHAAAALVPDAALAAELREVPYVSTATVFFGFERGDVARPLDGIGFIVPKGEARILAATWVSSKWQGRAPDGRVLLRAFVGGARGDVDVEHASDQELSSLALGELRRLMGSLGRPLFSRVYRFPGANPQPVVGHAARLERIRRRLEALPGLYVAGAAYEGVGIPDCVRQGRAAARRMVENATRS